MTKRVKVHEKETNQMLEKVSLQQTNLNFGQEINASSFVFEATGLLHLHPEVLHVGENHVLHRLAKM